MKISTSRTLGTSAIMLGLGAAAMFGLGAGTATAATGELDCDAVAEEAGADFGVKSSLGGCNLYGTRKASLDMGEADGLARATGGFGTTVRTSDPGVPLGGVSVKSGNKSEPEGIDPGFGADVVGPGIGSFGPY